MGPTSQDRPRLYTLSLGALLTVTLMGFAHQMVIQPVLPLLVLDRGGDATMVGLVVAAFSVPSVLLRPFFGRLVDEWSHRRVYLTGTVALGLLSVGYLISSIVALFAVRILHGTAWSAFNTGGHSMLARLAPRERRGEASGIYNLMPGLAQMAGPPLGLLLLAAYGFSGPFLVAAALGLAGGLVLLVAPLPTFRTDARAPARTGRGLRDLLEPGAVLPMTIEFLFSSTFALFWIYPPVFAAATGIPIEQLGAYYLAIGTILVVGRLVLGRVIDRFPRQAVVASGALLAIAGLVLAALVPTLLGLTLAGALYALAASFTPPTLMAAAIDRADPRRLGSAMATYTLGFQLALGAGAAAWGITIDLFGYPAPYLGAIAAQCIVLVLLTGLWSRRT